MHWPSSQYEAGVELPTSQIANEWPILLLFGQDVFSLAIFLLIENALEWKIVQIKYGLATILSKIMPKLAPSYTPSQWFLAPARLHVSTTATDSTNSDVSSKEGAVIGAVLSKRKFHQTHE
jgi:hypothetical protein